MAAITESKVTKLRVFMSIFNDRKIYASLCQYINHSFPETGGRCTTVFSFRRLWISKYDHFSWQSEGKQMAVDVNCSDGLAFRPAAAYAPTGPGKPEYFRRLEIFLTRP